MPRSSAEVAFQNFNKGLHTESSPFTFPTDAVSAIDNVVLEANGVARRRFGIDYEAGYGLVSSVSTSAAFGTKLISSFKWDNVNNDPDVSLGLIQVGYTLYVLDVSASAPSNNLLYTLDMAAASPFASWVGDSKLSYASLEGYLIVTAPTLNNVYRMEWNGSVLTPTAVTVQVRDFWGVDDSLAVDNKPASLSSPHNYNLLNQGWGSTNISAVQSSRGTYPANSEVWWLGKNSSDVFTVSILSNQDFGTTPAPKGRYIIGVRTRGADRWNAVGFPSSGDIEIIESETNNFAVVTSFSGRAFYAGLDSEVVSGDANSPNTTAMVFYSQLVSNADDLGKCYQHADPTSEHDSVLVPTDGGFLKLAGAGSIIHMQELSGRLIVFATNGVWEIFGGEGEFAADNYVTRQIADVPALNADTILSAEGSLLYWSNTGIYAVLPDPSTGRMTISNVIATTIQSHYKSIPSVGKLHATGIYDASSKEARWLYGDYPSSMSAYGTGGEFLHRYNKEIVFNVVTRSWTENTFDVTDTSYPFVMGYMKVPSVSQIANEAPVLANGVPVVASTVPVIVANTVEASVAIERKYLAAVLNGANYDVTLAELNDTAFLDWDTSIVGGVDFTSYIETGEITFGDVFRNKNTPYLYTHYNRTESGFVSGVGGAVTYLTPSSCTVQARWAFSDSTTSGYYGTAVETYRFNRLYTPSGSGDTFDYGHSIISTKTRIRGRGKSVRFRFSSSTGKDFQLVAWGVPVKAGARV